MLDIYALSLSASHASGQLTVAAFLTHRAGDKRYTVDLAWRPKVDRRTGEPSTEWLYRVLCAVVEDYDNHVVTERGVEGVLDMWETKSDA